MNASLVLARDHAKSPAVKDMTERIMELSTSLTIKEIIYIIDHLLENRVLNFECLIKLCKRVANFERLLIVSIYRFDKIQLIKTLITRGIIKIETLLEMFEEVRWLNTPAISGKQNLEETFMMVSNKHNKIIRTFQSLIDSGCYSDMEYFKNYVIFYRNRFHRDNISKKIFNGFCAVFRKSLEISPNPSKSIT
jgi:hypothetical protein